MAAQQKKKVVDRMKTRVTPAFATCSPLICLLSFPFLPTPSLQSRATLMTCNPFCGALESGRYSGYTGVRRHPLHKTYSRGPRLNGHVPCGLKTSTRSSWQQPCVPQALNSFCMHV